MKNFLLVASAAFFVFPASSEAYFWNYTSAKDSSTLTVAEEELLTYGQQEERMARDAYLTLSYEYGLHVFSNIARAENKHMDSMGRLIESHNLPETNGYGELTDMYTALIEEGMTSGKDALAVGVKIEVFDILDLKKSLTETDRSDITNALNNLLRGSYNHLNAFTKNLNRMGYTPEINWETGSVEIVEYSDSQSGAGNGRENGKGNSGGEGDKNLKKLFPYKKTR